MEKNSNTEIYAGLQKDDAGLTAEIMALLATCTFGDPYGRDGEFGASLAALPPGLRAMAATHWLDISLTLDSITWHFGNFGEATLVHETEVGLHELGLHELASCFREAKELMIPLLTGRTSEDDDPNKILEPEGLGTVAHELDGRAFALDKLGGTRSLIYEAWTQYARKHPEQVFPRTFSGPDPL